MRTSSRWWFRAAVATVAMTAALGLTLGGRAVLADIKRAPAGHVELRGSSAMQEMAQRSAEGYMVEHPESRVIVSAGGPRRGLKSVLVGTADIALFNGEIPDDLAKLAKERKIELVGRDVYRDAVVVVVHPTNPLADLPIWRVRDIFRGAVTNWKEVGGKDAPIVVVSLDSSTGAFETFKRNVMGDSLVVTPQATVVTYRDFDRTMRDTPNAIGYIGRRQNQFKAITVDGITASTETILSGTYPIQRRLRILHRKDAAPDVMGMVDYLTAADKGQAIVRTLGDVPEK